MHVVWGQTLAFMLKIKTSANAVSSAFFTRDYSAIQLRATFVKRARNARVRPWIQILLSISWTNVGLIPHVLLEKHRNSSLVAATERVCTNLKEGPRLRCSWMEHLAIGHYARFISVCIRSAHGILLHRLSRRLESSSAVEVQDQTDS